MIMKKFLVLLAVASVGLLSSCNKCKDDPCKNGASCDKKTGDCTCTTFYEGSDCATEIRKKYDGTYSGNLVASGQAMPTDVKVESTGSSATEQTFTLTVTTSPVSQAVYEVKATLTSPTEFEVEPTDANITIIPGSSTGKISGSGTYDGNKMEATIKIQATDGPANGFVVTGTYEGEK
jgi:hypothetical protein